MDLTRVEWWGGMSCARSSGGAGARDPSSGLGSLIYKFICSYFLNSSQDFEWEDGARH